MYDDISGNAEQFAQALNQLGQQIEDDVFDKVIRKALFDLLSEIVNNTPVDTGRAKGSWALDTKFSDFALPPGDYREAVQQGLTATMASLPKSSQYVIYNNLEYIVALENGHSKQAPSGFVAQALAAIGEHVAKAARAAGYEATA